MLRDLHHGRNLSSVCFIPSFFHPDLVVDLGDGSFAAPALHQLVDGAFAVALEFVQVLVEDLAGAQCRHQVVKLPADLV